VSRQGILSLSCFAVERKLIKRFDEIREIIVLPGERNTRNATIA